MDRFSPASGGRARAADLGNGGDLAASMTQPVKVLYIFSQMSSVKSMGSSRAVSNPGKDVLQSLYDAIREATGAAVIVDSSKSPSYAYLLDQRPGIDLHVIHLVRDCRANVFSSMHGVYHKEPDRSWSSSAIPRSISWMVWHLTIERLWRGREGRYIMVRYEDFATEPASTIARILDMVGVSPDQPPLARRTVCLHGNRSVFGNPRQVREGDAVVEEDRAWRLGMRRRDRILVRLLTSRLQRRYERRTFAESLPDLPGGQQST